MKYTSIYDNKNFKSKINPRFISSLITIGPIITLSIYPLFMDLPDENVSRGIFGIIERLKFLSSGELINLILVSIPISFVITGLLYKMHNFKRIIVQVEFKDYEGIIEFTLRKITNSKLEKKSLKYNDIQIEKVSKVYDAMSMSSYSGFEIKSNLDHIGYILNNHFVWSNSDVNHIIENIKKTKANTV